MTAVPDAGREHLPAVDVARSTRRISLSALAVVAATALMAGLAGTAVMHSRAQEELARQLEATLRGRADIVKVLVMQRELNALFVSHQPGLRRNLRAVAPGPPAAARGAEVGEILDSFLDLGFSSLQVRDTSGQLVAGSGTLAENPGLEATLNTPHRSVLLHADGLYLQVRLAILDGGTPIGELMTQQPLPILARLAMEARGGAGAMDLCARTAAGVRCFPREPGSRPYAPGTRFAAGPIASALDQRRGVAQIEIPAGPTELAAFGPVGALDLAMTARSPIPGLLAPAIENLPVAAALLLLLVAIGGGLIHLRVRPLAAELEQLLHQARVGRARLDAITENAPVLISYIDAERRFRFNNHTYESWLGTGREAITGKSVREVLGDAAYARFEPYLDRALGGERVEFETELIRDGRTRHVQGIYVPDVDSQGRVRGLYGIVTDITRLKVAETQLLRLARTDALTGVPNRTLLMERLHHSLSRLRRHGPPLAVAYLDLDGFKSINDRLGHSGGDALLVEFARRLKGCVRESDTVARLGGDEFAVLLEDVADAGQAREVAEKILSVVREPVLVAGQVMRITTSIGLCVVLSGEAAAETLLGRADKALYRAKALGRDRMELA